MGLASELAAASLRWKGVRAMRVGETGGFPLIIYSLSLGNQAISPAKLSLVAPGRFEAEGYLNLLSGGTVPAHLSWEEAGGSAPHTCRSALRTTCGLNALEKSKAAHTMGHRAAVCVALSAPCQHCVITFLPAPCHLPTYGKLPPLGLRLHDPGRPVLSLLLSRLHPWLWANLVTSCSGATVLPWQVKQRMWKWLLWTRTTSPLQVSPQR